MSIINGLITKDLLQLKSYRKNFNCIYINICFCRTCTRNNKRCGCNDYTNANTWIWNVWYGNI